MPSIEQLLRPARGLAALLQRLVETKRAVHIVDLAMDEGYLRGDAIGRALLDIGGARTALDVHSSKMDL